MPGGRIAIVGAGAMGGVYGALLSEAGVDVTLVDVSPELSRAVREHGGLRVEREGTTRTVDVTLTDDPSTVSVVDAVLFFVKCYHTAAAAQAARPMVGPGTVVASLQNGWGNGETLRGVFGGTRLVVGVSYHSATVREPGLVVHTAVGPTLVGGAEPDAQESAALLGDVLVAALDVTVTTTVLDEIWKKLVLNSAALPTSALTGYTAGALAVDEAMMDLVEGLTREAVAVALADGRAVDLDERVGMIRTALARAGAGKASMLQDFEAGRRTEIDVINGAIVRYGARHGVPTPLNAAMVALVHGHEVAHQY